MDKNDYEKYMKGLFKKALEMHQKKSHDYADELDVLSNFKRLSQVAEIMNIDVQTPYGYALFMIIMKIDRINNLMQNDKTPNNESIDDTILDMVVYTVLMGACINEELTTKEENRIIKIVNDAQPK